LASSHLECENIVALGPDGIGRGAERLDHLFRETRLVDEGENILIGKPCPLHLSGVVEVWNAAVLAPEELHLRGSEVGDRTEKFEEPFDTIVLCTPRHVNVDYLHD